MNLRAAMPRTAAFIDELRAAFGAAAINAEIRKGMVGLPDHFHARENTATKPAPRSSIVAAG